MFLVRQGIHRKAGFVGKSFVRFHSGFLIRFCSFTTQRFHFIGNLPDRRLGKSCFLSVAKVGVVCNNFVNLAVVFSSSRRVWRSVSAPNKARS
jgi:formate/nitrite transporter FocA (FNT family)